MAKKTKALRLKRAWFVHAPFLLLLLTASVAVFPGVAAAVDSKDLNFQSAQQIGGPLLGILYEPSSHKFRELVGVPGASFQGDLLDPGFPILQSWISPGHEFALAENTNRQMMVIRFNPVPELLSLPGDSQIHPARLSFSRDGNSAVAYDAQSQLLIVWRGINAGTAGYWEQQLDWVQGSVTSLAVTEDGGKVLLANETGNAATLYLLTENGAPQAHQTAGAISAISFFPGGTKALFADRTANELWFAQSLTAAFNWVPLSALRGKVSDPVGVDVTQDGRKIVAANAGTGTVLIYDLLDSQVETIQCSQKPETLTRLIGPDIFLLNAAGESPIWLLKVEPGSSTTFFVPASHSTQGRALYDSRGNRSGSSRNRERRDQ